MKNEARAIGSSVVARWQRIREARLLLLSPKGWDNIAQGNALGIEVRK